MSLDLSLLFHFQRQPLSCAGPTWLRGVLGSGKKGETAAEKGAGPAAELETGSGHSGNTSSSEKPMMSASSEKAAVT